MTYRMLTIAVLCSIIVFTFIGSAYAVRSNKIVDKATFVFPPFLVNGGSAAELNAIKRPSKPAIPAYRASLHDVESAIEDNVGGSNLNVGDVRQVGKLEVSAVKATDSDILNAIEDNVGGSNLNVGDVRQPAVPAVKATADDVEFDASLNSGHSDLTVGDVLQPAVPAVLYTQEDVDKARSGDLKVGDVLQPAVPAVPAVLYTQEDVAVGTVTGNSISFTDEHDDLVTISSRKKADGTVAIVTKSDGGTINITVNLSGSDITDINGAQESFGTNSNDANIFAEAMLDVLVGDEAINNFITKLKPDVGVAVSGSIGGIGAVANVVGSHQSNLVASSGKYGSKKYLASNTVDESGISSGDSILSNSFWIKPFGTISQMGTRDGISGYNARGGGVVFGFNHKLSDDFLIGLAVSYADIKIAGKSISQSQTDIHQYQGTLYSTLILEDYFINSSLAYAHSLSDTKRQGLGGTVEGSYGTDIYSVSLGAGYPIHMTSILLVPQIDASYSYVSPESYEEIGKAALNISSEDMELFSIKAGINASTTPTVGNITYKLRLMADWDVLQSKGKVRSSWVKTGVNLVPISGPEPAALGGVVGAGLEYLKDDGSYGVSIDYDLNARDDFVSHTASVKISLNF